MMEPVASSEIVDIAQYEKQRPAFREKVMATKERRRMRVGDHFTFLFENHDTVLYQVQEMMRVERIVDEDAIEHEIKTYNELIPPKGSLSASLLIEYEDRPAREENLPKLVGIQDHVWLQVGDLEPVKAAFDERQMDETRVSSVQYIKFHLPEQHQQAWREAAEHGQVVLRVDHPHYDADSVVPKAVAEALYEDLTG